MSNGDETADSYKTTADLLLGKKGDKIKILNYLLKAASLYSEKNRAKAINCLDQLYQNLRGSTAEIEMDQYFRYLHQLARAYEERLEEKKAADTYSELAKDFYKKYGKSMEEDPYKRLKTLKKFIAYLAKALMLYDIADMYDQILKLARVYYKEFPKLQLIESIHGEIFFCYEHIIKAADMTGSRYFREYYSELDKKLRGAEEPTLPEPLIPEQKY